MLFYVIFDPNGPVYVLLLFLVREGILSFTRRCSCRVLEPEVGCRGIRPLRILLVDPEAWRLVGYRSRRPASEPPSHLRAWETPRLPRILDWKPITIGFSSISLETVGGPQSIGLACESAGASEDTHH